MSVKSPQYYLKKAWLLYAVAVGLSLLLGLFVGYALGKVRGQYLAKKNDSTDLSVQNALLTQELEQLRNERDVKDGLSNPSVAGSLDILRANVKKNGKVYGVEILVKNGRSSDTIMQLFSNDGKISVPLAPRSQGADGVFSGRFVMPDNFHPSFANISVDGQSFEFIWAGGDAFDLVRAPDEAPKQAETN